MPYHKAMLKKEDEDTKDRMELAARVREAINSLGRGGKRKIAEQCKISEQAITGWLKTGRIHKNNIAKVAELTNFNITWLLTGKGPKTAAEGGQPNIESNAEWQGGLSLWDNNTPLDDDEVALPFFKEVELAAGTGSAMVQENHGRKLRFSKATLRSCGVTPAHAACVTVSGNSMEPILPDGATIGIDTSQTTIKDGKVYAIEHDGHLRVKRLYRMPGGKIRLNSYNKDEWPDETVTPDEIRILGKVFWSSVLWE